MPKNILPITLREHNLKDTLKNPKQLKTDLFSEN